MSTKAIIGIILLSLTLGAASPVSQRPRLLGVAKFAVRVSDLDRAREFYRDLLGYQEAYPYGKSVLFKINERQFIELAPGLQPTEDRLISTSWQTDSAERMRQFLAQHGWKVPSAISQDPLGNRIFHVADPDGHALEFIEFPANGKIRREQGKFLGRRRISTRMMHTGIIVGDVPQAMVFYAERLGLREFWRGAARDSKTLSWINMKLPESEDYLEFMLYEKLPAPDKRGSQHHLCLEVADIEQARLALEGNPYRAKYGRPIEVRVGVNRRRQINLFDPDGTRSELMEPTTIDGIPPASSTLGPPGPPPSRRP